MDKLKSRHWNPYEQPREGYRIVYLQSHVRTRHWFKDGKTIVWGEDDDDTPRYGAAKTQRTVRAITDTVSNGAR